MSLRPALLTTVALAATLGICCALYRWGARGTGDLWTLTRALQHGEELESHVAAGQPRDEAKRVLAAEVLAGKLSLREAADQFRRLDEADPDFPAHIVPAAGEERPLGESVLDAVWEVLRHQERYAAAAHWYAEVFAAHPHLLPGPPSWHRYHAAFAAAQAAAGQGRDAADLDEESRAGFRRQAMDWLQAELEAQRRLLEQEPAKALTVARALQDWLWDLHLVGVREPDALAQLSETERQAWHQLWADVTDTLALAVRRIPSAQRVVSKIPLPQQ
jgi:hypothetical protein